MPLYLHFIAFDFMHMAESSRGRIDAMYLVPKRCKVAQHTPDTQHVFFTLFHDNSRVARAFIRNLTQISATLTPQISAIEILEEPQVQGARCVILQPEHAAQGDRRIYNVYKIQSLC